MCAFLLCTIPLKFGRAGREDIWVMTHGRRCALSVSHASSQIFAYKALTLSL